MEPLEVWTCQRAENLKKKLYCVMVPGAAVSAAGTLAFLVLPINEIELKLNKNLKMHKNMPQNQWNSLAFFFLRPCLLPSISQLLNYFLLHYFTQMEPNCTHFRHISHQIQVFVGK